MSAHLQQIKDLNPIAIRMRERQEEIINAKRKLHGNIGDLISLAADQGRDCIVAKTKLGGRLGWSEWLRAHVPTLPKTEAEKYERLTVEQLTDVRRGVFALLPEPERQAPTEAPRQKPTAFDLLWGHCNKIRRLVARLPETQRGQAREQLEPIVRELWPDAKL